MKHIVLDFDSTSGKVTESHLNNFAALVAEKTSIDPSEVFEIMNSLSKSGLSIQLILQTLEIDDENFYQECMSSIKDGIQVDVLYEDTLDFLSRSRELGHTISVLTFGGMDFQELKVRNTGMFDLLNTYRVTTSRGTKPTGIQEILDELEYHPEDEIIFVDDKQEELDSVKNTLEGIGIKVSTFLMDRQNKLREGRHPEDLSSLEVNGHRVISSFNEIEI